MKASRWIVLSLVVVGGAFAGTRGVEATFVAGPRIDDYTGAVARGGDWACGAELVRTTVDRMPNAAFMTGDDIQELDDQGRVLRTWRVPLESAPVGIDGERLIVTLTLSAGDPTVSVDAAGRLHRVPAPPAVPESAHAQCPANKLPESGYRWCVSLPDQAARGTSRLIAYEGPCT